MTANEVDWTIGGMSDPLTVQAKILDRFEDVTGNAIVDPNNPASVIMEGFASLASSMVRSIEDTVRPAIYPARANTAEDLFKHLSDYDYVDVFASPASTTVLLILDKLYTLVNSVGTTEDASYKKLIIPRSTVITVGTHTFGLYYPIEIRSSLETGQITITYDTSEVNPLKSMTSNKLEYDIKIHNNRELIYLKVPCYQFETNIVENVMTPGTGLKVNVDYTNKFYAIRCFAQVLTNYRHESDVEDKWEEKELSLCVGGQTYDPEDPTVVFTPDLENNKVKLEIPYVYFTEGRIRGTLRSIIYTTEGEMNYQIPLDTTDVCSLDMFSKLTDDTIAPYVNPFKQMPALAVVPISTNIIGGSNGLTFEQLRSQVVSGSIRSNTIQTPADIDAFFAKEGYTTTLLKDGITDRVFITRATLKNASGEVVSADDTDTLFDFRADVLKDYDTIAVSGDNVFTVYPSTLYKYDNDQGVSVPLTALERKRLMGLSPAEKVAAFNNNVYTLSPFHLQVDTSSKYPTTTTYDMTDIDVKSQELITERTDEVPCQLTLIASTITLVENGPKNDYKFTFEVSKTGLDGVDPVVKSDDMMGRKNIRVLVAFRGVDDTYHFAEATYAGASESGADVFELVIPTDYKFSKENGEYSVALKIDTLHDAESKKMEYKVNLTSEVRVILCLEGEIKNVGDILGSGYRTLDTDYSTIITVDNLNNYYALSENRLICRYGSVVDEVDQRINLGYAKQEYKKHASTKFLTISTPIYATDEDGNIQYSIKEENGESRIEITEKFPIGTLTAVTKTEDKAMQYLTIHNNTTNYKGLSFANETVADIIATDEGYYKYTYDLSELDEGSGQGVDLDDRLNDSGIYYLSEDGGLTGEILERMDFAGEYVWRNTLADRIPLSISFDKPVKADDIDSARQYKGTKRVSELLYTAKVDFVNHFHTVKTIVNKREVTKFIDGDPDDTENENLIIDDLKILPTDTISVRKYASLNDKHLAADKVTSVETDTGFFHMFFLDHKNSDNPNTADTNIGNVVSYTWSTVGHVQSFDGMNSVGTIGTLRPSYKVEDPTKEIKAGYSYLGKRNSDVKGLTSETAANACLWVEIPAANTMLRATKYRTIPAIAKELFALRDRAENAEHSFEKAVTDLAASNRFATVNIGEIPDSWVRDVLTTRQYATLLNVNDDNRDNQHFLWHYKISFSGTDITGISTITSFGGKITDALAEDTAILVVKNEGLGDIAYNGVVAAAPEDDNRPTPYKVLNKYTAPSYADIQEVLKDEESKFVAPFFRHKGLLYEGVSGPTMLSYVDGVIPKGTCLEYELCEVSEYSPTDSGTTTRYNQLRSYADAVVGEIVDFVPVQRDQVDGIETYYIREVYATRIGDIRESDADDARYNSDIRYEKVYRFRKVQGGLIFMYNAVAYIGVVKDAADSAREDSPYVGNYYESDSSIEGLTEYVVDIDMRPQPILLRTSNTYSKGYSTDYQSEFLELFSKTLPIPSEKVYYKDGDYLKGISKDVFVKDASSAIDKISKDALYIIVDPMDVVRGKLTVLLESEEDITEQEDKIYNVCIPVVSYYLNYSLDKENTVYFRTKDGSAANYNSEFVRVSGYVYSIATNLLPQVYASTGVLKGTNLKDSPLNGYSYYSSNVGGNQVIDYPIEDKGAFVAKEDLSYKLLVDKDGESLNAGNGVGSWSGLIEKTGVNPAASVYLVTDGETCTIGDPEVTKEGTNYDTYKCWFFDKDTHDLVTKFEESEIYGSVGTKYLVIQTADRDLSRATNLSAGEIQNGTPTVSSDTDKLMYDKLLIEYDKDRNISAVRLTATTVADLMIAYNLSTDEVYAYTSSQNVFSSMLNPSDKLDENVVCFFRDSVNVEASISDEGEDVKTDMMKTKGYERIPPMTSDVPTIDQFKLLSRYYNNYTVRYDKCSTVPNSELYPILFNYNPEYPENKVGVTIYISDDDGDTGKVLEFGNYTIQDILDAADETQTIHAIRAADSEPIDVNVKKTEVGTGNVHSVTFLNPDTRRQETWIIKYDWTRVSDMKEKYGNRIAKDKIFVRYVDMNSQRRPTESESIDDKKLYWSAYGSSWTSEIEGKPRKILNATTTSTVTDQTVGRKTVYNAPIIPTLKISGSYQSDIVGNYEMHDALNVRENTRRNVVWDGTEAANNRSGFDNNAIFVDDALMTILKTIGLIEYDEVSGSYVFATSTDSNGNVLRSESMLPTDALEGTFYFVKNINIPDEDAYLLSERSENQTRSGLYYKTTTGWKCLIEGPVYEDFMSLVLARINDPTKTSYGYVYCVGDRNALETNDATLIRCINFLTTKEMKDGSTIPDMVPNEETTDPNEDWNTRVGKWPWDVKDWRIVRKDRKRGDTNYVTFEYDTLFEISLDTSRMAKYCEYMSGSYDLDENGQLQVVEGGDRYIQYVISMIHIDAKLAQTTINQTNKTYPDSITGVMRTHFDNLASIKNEMFTNSRLYFAPVKSIGRATFSVGNDKTEELPLDVEVSFRLHVSRATATDDQLLLSIKNNIVEIIDNKILKGYLNCPEVASEIMATMGNVVNYVDVLGINGDTNLQTMKCVDTVGVPHLKHRLVLMDDDQTIDIERAVNLDVVIND